MALGKTPAATQAFEKAVSLWSNVAALRWIRTLPSGEASQGAVRDASSAAAASAFHSAEIWHEENSNPRSEYECPEVKLGHFDDLIERKRHWFDAQRRCFEQGLRPWIERYRDILELAEHKYARVLLVAPEVSPYWRIAVAAKTGQMWGQFVKAVHAIIPRVPWEYSGTHSALAFVSGDDPSEGYKQYARSAFETCTELSRKYRIVSQYTLACEDWLSLNYKAEHHRLDEWIPPADWRPRNPLREQPAATIGGLTR